MALENNDFGGVGSFCCGIPDGGFELVLVGIFLFLLLLGGFGVVGLLGGSDGRSQRQAAEAIALEFLEHPESSGVGAAGCGLVALEHAAGGFLVGIGEEGDGLPGVGIEVFEYFCVGFGLQIHFDFGEGAFDGADAGQAPGGGDHLVDEVALDVVGRGEAVEVAEGVLDEDFGVFVG